jgi:hypothetical protein
MNTELFTQTDLDRFSTLQAARRKEVSDNGLKFEIRNSDKSVTAVVQTDTKSLLVSDETNLHPGLILNNRRTGNVYILAVSKHAGYSVANYAEVSGKLEKYYRRKDGTYCPDGSILTIRHPNGSPAPCVPVNACPKTGTVIKYCGILHTVTGGTLDGNIVELHIEPVSAPTVKQPRHENKFKDPINFDRPYQVMQWRN